MWWRGIRGATTRIPTTAVGAEYALVLAFVVIRLFDLAQMMLAAPLSLAESPNRTLDGALMAVFVIESVVLCWVLLRRREYTDPRLALIDLTLGLLVAYLAPRFIPKEDALSSWGAWVYPVTLSVAIGLGIGLRRWWQTIVGVAALSGLYLSGMLSMGLSEADRTTVISNSLAFLMFAIAARVPADYIRRLAADADVARGQAATSAQEAERARHRLLLHDQASVLTLLSRAETDPALAAVARAQAALGASRVRKFMSDDHEETMPLALRLEAVVSQFPDLDPTLNLDCAQADIPNQTIQAICEAVGTLLHNVRNHAQASEVVVYAQADGCGWEVQVSDDGRGFDPDTTADGFGLGQQVKQRIHDVRGAVALHSAPGRGTTVRMTGVNA